jgi:alpha-beta hydrolase superfamily lysophospholipase
VAAASCSTWVAFNAYNKAFEPARTEFDWLSSDAAQVEAYIADPWCGILPTTQFWIDLLSGIRVIADPERQRQIPKQLPILVFSGELDPVGEPDDRDEAAPGRLRGGRPARGSTTASTPAATSCSSR